MASNPTSELNAEAVRVALTSGRPLDLYDASANAFVAGLIGPNTLKSEPPRHRLKSSRSNSPDQKARFLRVSATTILMHW